MKYISIIFLAITTLFACTKVLPYDDTFASQLNLNGSINLNADTHRVLLSTTISPLVEEYDHESSMMGAASFALKLNGQEQSIEFRAVEHDPNTHFTEFELIYDASQVQIGDEVELSVTYPGYETIQATAKAHKPYSNLVIKKGREVEGEWDTYQEVIFYFNDPPGLGDRYLIEIPGDPRTVDPILLQEEGAAIDGGGYISYWGEPISISDALFDGERVSITVEVDAYDYQYINRYVTYQREFKKVSQEEYAFARAVEDQGWSDPAFEEPVIVLGNVSNGVGIFGLRWSELIVVPE